MSRIRNLTTALAAVLLAAAPSLHAVELQSVAGTDTKLNVYGFVWSYTNYYAQGQDNNYAPTYAGSLFYAGNGANFNTDFSKYPTGQFNMNVLPTRFGFATSTPSANLGDVTTKIEYDMNNGKGMPGLRLAWISIGGLTVGKQWSMWNDLDASPDTVDWAGPIGTACYDTPRYASIQYVGHVDKNNTLGISIDQNSSQGDGATGTSSASDSKLPTFIGMYTYADNWGHIGVRAMGQNYGAYIPATATTGRQHYSKVFFAGMLSGDIKIAKDDLVFNVYDGKGLGNYGTGIQAAVLEDKTQTVTGLQNIGWDLGYTHNWTDAVRSNIVISGVTFKSDSSTLAVAALTDGTNGTLLKTGYFGEINTFVKLAKNLQFGACYVYEQAKSFGSNNPWTDFDSTKTTKINNNKIELALKANF